MPVLANLRLLAFAALPLLSQTLENPPTALAFHSASRSLRPIIGIPGSSYLGAPLLSDLDFASIAPDQKTGVAVSNGSTRLIRNIQDPASVSAPIENAIAAVDQVLWSVDSTTAILLSSTQREIQWITAGQAVPLYSLANMSGKIRLLAADPQAQVAIVAAAGQLFRITNETAPTLLATVGNPTAAVFDRTGQVLYVADAAARQIFELRYGTQTAFLKGAEGIEDPVARALSEDGTLLYVASQSSRSVAAFRTADSSLVGRLSLDWAPTSFTFLSRGTFLLNRTAPAGEPFSVLTTHDGLAEAFIPTGDVKP